MVFEGNGIALFAVESISFSELQTLIEAVSPNLSSFRPFIIQAPAHPGRTIGQTKAKSKLWPVTHLPFRGSRDQDGWSRERLEWMLAGAKRVIKEGLEAGDRGEVSMCSTVSMTRCLD